MTNVVSPLFLASCLLMLLASRSHANSPGNENFKEGASPDRRRGLCHGCRCHPYSPFFGALVCANISGAAVPACDYCAVRGGSLYVMLLQSQLRRVEMPAVYSGSLVAIHLERNDVAEWGRLDINALPRLQDIHFNRQDLGGAAKVFTDMTAPTLSVTAMGFRRCGLRSLQVFPPFKKFFPSVRHLMLEENRLETMPAEYVPAGLVSLELAGNQIKTVSADNFGFLPALKLASFNLSGNPLTEFSFEVLPRRLTFLSLSDTQMSEFDFLALVRWKAAATAAADDASAVERTLVSLSGTVLECSCSQARGAIELHRTDHLALVCADGLRCLLPLLCGDLRSTRRFNTVSADEDVCAPASTWQPIGTETATENLGLNFTGDAVIEFQRGDVDDSSSSDGVGVGGIIAGIATAVFITLALVVSVFVKVRHTTDATQPPASECQADQKQKRWQAAADPALA